MSTDSIIKKELLSLRKQALNEVNTFGFPTGSVDSGKVNIGGEGGNWGGSMERTLEIASLAKKCLGKDNVISSQKRSRVKTASGNVSDHYQGNLKAYAVDIPVRGKAGDELLACIMKSWDNGSHSDYKGGKWLNVNKDGYRYQFGWRVKGHYDHIHVGVKKTGSSNTTDDEFANNEKDDDKTEVVKTDPKKSKNTKQLSSLDKLGLVYMDLAGIKPEEDDTTDDEDDDEVSDKDEDSTEESSTELKTTDAVKVSGFSIVEPSNEDKDFYIQVLEKINAPVTSQNLLFFYAWRQAEGAKSTFNPFNTTQKKDNSTFWNCLKRKEGKCLGGVRNYQSKTDGIDATAKTLTNGRYGCIVDKLRANKGAIETAKCSSDLKTWGTRDGISRVLGKKSVSPPSISKTKVKSVNESLLEDHYNIKKLLG